MHELRPGYHFVERRFIGRKIEDPGEPMSIVALLRCLRGRIRLPRAVQVHGLESLLAQMQDREVGRFLRRLLTDASDWLMQHSPSIVIFPVEQITLNREPHLIYDRQELRFVHVFGRGLQQEDVVRYFTAPFALS